MSTWYAGAGRAVVKLTDQHFPTAEGYVGVRGEMAVRALYVESEEKALIVTVEQTSIMSQTMAIFRRTAAEKSGVAEDRIWITATHTFGVPHIWDDDAGRLKNDEDRRRNTMMQRAFADAVAEAASAAVKTKQVVRIGYAETVCNVNINRDLLTAEGYWLGPNEAGLSDKTVAVVRFENLNGDPVGIFFNYGVQSSVTQGVSKLMCGDLASAACDYLEREYGVPAIFCVGACGDQAPVLQGKSFETDRNGKLRELGISTEAAFGIADLLGARLGKAAAAAAGQALCSVPEGRLKAAQVTIDCPGQKMLPIPELHPTFNYDYVSQGRTPLEIEALDLGDVILIGAKPEMTAQLGISLKQCAHGKVILCNMVNGAAKYLAHDSAYASCTYPAMNSRYARGSGELFLSAALELMETL